MLRTIFSWVFAIFCCTDVFAGTPTGPRKTEEKNRRRLLLLTQIGSNINGLDSGDSFGHDVAISGDGETVVVGAPFRREAAVFELDGGNWVQKGGYIDGLESWDYTGCAVGLSSDGDTIAVGAFGANAKTGKVTIYSFNGSAWNFNREFPGEAAKDYSGIDLAISSAGDTVLIGAIANRDGGGRNAGHARAYRLDGSTWNLLGDDIDGDKGDYAGNAVAMSGDGTIIAVAAMYSDAGQVRMFELNSDSSWSQRGLDINGDAADDGFGRSVAMNSDGRVVVVGSTPARSSSRAPYVRAFKWSIDKWNQMGNDLDGEHETGDGFGYSVAVDGSGRIIAVGAPYIAVSGTANGAVFLFEWNEVDNWERRHIVEGEGLNDQFGTSVAMSSDGTTVVVGARDGNVNGVDSGYVKVFDTGVLSPPTPVTAAVSGDPHFRTWSGIKYDFHGVCDLVLLQNPGFQDNLGMDIHVRTKLLKKFSYVSSAVLRIGDDTLEVMGDIHENRYWINKEPGNADNDIAGFINGYSISLQQVNLKEYKFIVDLGDNASIILKTFKKFVHVSINGATKEKFRTSLGLLGAYGSGDSIARDGKTVMQDTNAFGEEWQVLPSELMMFHNVEGPQAPERCLIPLSNTLRRRLAESNVSEEEANIACAHVSSADFDMCVFDVMATGDKDVAGAY